MPDKEKVINGLEHLSEWLFQQYRVVYDGDAPNYYDAYKTVDDALALLKEQEAVKPKKENDGNPEPCTSWWYVCGDCGRYIDPHDRFCRHCGREVDWDGSDA